MDKPIRVQGIDVEIQIIFRAEHLNLLKPQFERIGLEENTCDNIIDAFIASGEQVSLERFILEYGQGFLNPIMNLKLGRSVDHPTFNNILKFVLKDVINADSTLNEFRKFKENK